MNVLVACEYSGVVRDAFASKGHNAWSCDLLPTESPGNHYQGDIFDSLSEGGFFNGVEWDLLIAHPPCTYLSVSGLHWNKRDPERQGETDRALEFVDRLFNLPINKICLENPVGCINSRLDMPKPQYIQPYEFGHDASKKTGLWLKNLPKLHSTKFVYPREVLKNGKPYKRWANQTDSGQNNLAPSEDRWKIRSKTYSGIAKAMAEQWG